MTGGPLPEKRLAVLVDGIPLPDEDAHALWDRFSLWMEEHRGDLAGFAVQEGYLSIHPGVDGDRPVLRASKSAAQRPYAPVRADGDRAQGRSGGSPARPGGAPIPDRRSGNPRDFTKKPRK